MSKNKFCSEAAAMWAVLFLAVLIGTLATDLGQAQARSIGVAVIGTENVQSADASLHQLFKDELIALFKGEHDIRLYPFAISRDAAENDVNSMLDRAYANPKTEMVLVLDFAANQLIGRRAVFPKPTFLPIVINGQLLGYPMRGTGSGKENLNYQTLAFRMEDELQILRSVAPFKRAVLIGDARIIEILGPTMIAANRTKAKRIGVDLTVRTFTGDTQALLSSIPPETDAILYGAYPTASRQQIQRLIDGVNDKNLVSFALSGEAYVRMGALATNSPDTDWKKLARRTAIHMQEVFLGKPAATLPVFFEATSRLMINMQTSRAIRYAPSFDVLSDATLINQDFVTSGEKYSLTDVARKAVKVNLSIAAQRLQAQSTGEAVKEARGALLPQLNASVSYSTRKETDTTRTGQIAENSTDGSLKLTQSIFSEERWAAYAIQKNIHLSEKEVLREIELDIIQSAVNAYLNVLREKTSLDQERYNLDITRRNYQLAKNRVDVGTSDASDLYRWESELANAKRSVLSAKSSLEQQRQSLNRILDRPIAEEFTTSVESLDNPALLVSDKRITDLITNPYALQELTDFLVQRGLERAPELKQLEAQIAANKRQLDSDRRAYWLPDVNLTGTYTHNFEEDRAAGGIAAEENDWSVGVELSIPLFEGGSRYARTAQSRLAVKQLEANYRNSKNTVEQEIRSTLEAAHASYNSIDLAKLSEEASQKNYDLVAASYAQGRDSIVDLLDAQEALIAAREASMNAVYSYLIDLMNVQRAIGAFDFFLTDSERSELSEEIITRMRLHHTRQNEGTDKQ